MKCKVKRNTKKVTLLLSLLLLSSCNLEVTFFPYTHHISDTDTYTRIETSDYYKVGAFARSYQDVLKSNLFVLPKLIKMLFEFLLPYIKAVLRQVVLIRKYKSLPIKLV